MLSTNYKKLYPFGVQLESMVDRQELRSLVLEHGLVVIKNYVTQSDDEIINFASRLSENHGPLESKLLHWHFGPLMKMKVDANAKNYLFSKEKVPLHWDGAFHKEPLFLLFHCEHSQGLGGETIFCNTSLAYSHLSESEKNLAKEIRLKFETEQLAHYGGKIENSLIQQHPILNTEIIRYAEEVQTSLNPVLRKVLNDHHTILVNIEKKINKFKYAHSWQTNDLLIADNFTLIHGRNELKENENRRFNRLQIL